MGLVKTTFPSLSTYEESCACAGTTHNTHIISEITKLADNWHLMIVREKQSGRFPRLLQTASSRRFENTHPEAHTTQSTIITFGRRGYKRGTGHFLGWMCLFRQPRPGLAARRLCRPFRWPRLG